MSLCSDDSRAVGEDPAGSAPEAAAWVVLEQNGPWGRDALVDSHLDSGLGRRLKTLAGSAGVRPALVRRPGRHADTHIGGGPRRLLVAYTAPGRSWLLAGDIDSPERVLDVDLTALAAGRREVVRRSLSVLEPQARAQLLVCTNASRDLCCAVKGRALAVAAAARHPGRVWEVTHTSGHRFAPTAVLLPAGTLHGRIDPATDLLEAADRGETVLAGARGRSTWPPPAQAAELAVRRRTGELGLDALIVDPPEPAGPRSWRVVVRHGDGRTWTVAVTAEASGLRRRESCAKSPVAMERYATRLNGAAVR